MPDSFLDIVVPKATPVVAFASGQIALAKPLRGGGRTIMIHGDDGNTYVYMHLDKFGPNVKVGEKVEAGELIGYVGRTTGTKIDKKTGMLQESGAAHLHFEIHVGYERNPATEKRIDPYEFILKALHRQEWLSPEKSEKDYPVVKALGLGTKPKHLQNIVFDQPRAIPKLSDVLWQPESRPEQQCVIKSW